MKKQNLLLGLALLLSFSGLTQNWVEFSPSESTKPVQSVSISNDTLVKFNVTIPGVFNTLVDTFNRVEIQGHSKMDSVGFSEVPIVSFLLAIPKCDSVYLDIDLQDSTAISDLNIYPAPELVPDTIEGGAIALIEEFTYDSNAYETNAYFPGILAEAIDKGAIRDQNCVRVLMYPVQFNPATKTVNAFSKCNITLTFKNPSGKVNTNVGILNEVVGNSLINYQSNGLNASVSCGAGLADTGSVYWVTELPNQKVDSACDYLIITHQSFYTDTISRNEIDALAQHRAGFNGFDVVIVKMDDIINSGSIPGLFPFEKIKGLLKGTYDNGFANNTFDDKLAYINLFGDAFFGSDEDSLCVPTYEEGYDVYFTQVYPDEDDVYPDLMIGRCSVDDTEQVRNVVHKILNLKINS